MNNHHLLIIVIASLGVASCSQETATPDSSGFLPTPLPAPSGGGTPCDENIPTPTLCDWVNSVDAVVVGNIVDADALTSPVWVDDYENSHLADVCDADWMNAGLSLKISVTSVLSGDPPKVIDVRVGARATNWDGVRPSGANGKLEWVEAGLKPADAYFKEGTTIGLALTRVPDTDVWALMGDMPFTFDVDGSAIYSGSDCSWPAPTSRPTDFWALESAVKACPQQPNARKDARLDLFTQRPDYSHAATCPPTEIRD